MSVHISSNNDYIVQAPYGDDNDRHDEWYIRPKILPLSGYECTYNPEIWNRAPVQGNTNCYSYAFNTQVDPRTGGLGKMQPGYTRGYYIPQGLIEEQSIRIGVQADSSALGFMFEQIEKYAVCSAGSYKVALVVELGVDYHWYRQNADGTWSHKPGETPVTNLDMLGNLIYDPEVAASNYSVFVGFFAVAPFNSYYPIM